MYSVSGPDADGVDCPDCAGDLPGGPDMECGSPDLQKVPEPGLLVEVGKERAHVPDLLDLLERLFLPVLDDIIGTCLRDLPGVRRIPAGG